jgi:hypothetical protein
MPTPYAPEVSSTTVEDEDTTAVEDKGPPGEGSQSSVEGSGEMDPATLALETGCSRRRSWNSLTTGSPELFARNNPTIISGGRLKGGLSADACRKFKKKIETKPVGMPPSSESCAYSQKTFVLES